MTYTKAELTEILAKIESAINDLERLEKGFRGVICVGHVRKSFQEIENRWEARAKLMPWEFGRELDSAAAYLTPDKNDSADFSDSRMKLKDVRGKLIEMLAVYK